MALVYEKRECVLNFRSDKKKVYRIAPVKQTAITFEKLLDETSISCGMRRSLIKMCVEALLDRTALFLDCGVPVQMGEFGSFRPTFQAKAQDRLEDLGVDNIRKRKVTFWAGKRLKRVVRKVEILSDGRGLRRSSSKETDR